MSETPAPLRAKLAQDAARIMARYPQARSALLPLLHLVESEEGYVSTAGIALCAELLGLTETDVTAVVSYHTVSKRKPAGDAACDYAPVVMVNWEFFMSSIGYFRDEYLEHQKRRGCPFDPAESVLAEGGQRA